MNLWNAATIFQLAEKKEWKKAKAYIIVIIIAIYVSKRKKQTQYTAVRVYSLYSNWLTVGLSLLCSL